MSTEKDSPTPDSSTPADTAQDNQPSSDTGSTNRARRREAALRRLQRTKFSKRTAALFGASTILAVAAVTAAGTSWGPDAPQLDTAARAAELPATPLLSVCPGPPALPAGAGEDEDLDFSPLSSDAATALTVTATSDLAGTIPGMHYRATSATTNGPGSAVDITEPLAEDLQQGPPATAAQDGTVQELGFFDLITDPADQPLALSTQPVGGRPGTSAATTQYAATDGDLAGMTVGACTPAAHSHWLTGAITTTGTTAVLTMTNPSATNSTVDLTVYGTNGRIEASGATGIVLAPGQSRSMLVAGLAPRETSVAVQVAASGGPVAATIHQHRLDGIVPAGVDTLQPVAPGATAVIPGMMIPEDSETIAAGSGLDGQTPDLHLASAGGAASVTITLRGPDGPVTIPAAASAVDLAPGSTTTVDLSGVAPGIYAVEIQSDASILATATSLTFNPAADNADASGNTAAVDTAYMPATTPVRGDTMVALPALGNPDTTLVLTAGSDATVSITPIDDDGETLSPMTQEIAANTAVTVTHDDAAAYLIESGSGTVHAGLLVETSAGISAMPINSVAETGAALPVRLGY